MSLNQRKPGVGERLYGLRVRAVNKEGLFLDVTNYGPAGDFGAWIQLAAARDKVYALHENGPNFDCYAAGWESTGRPTSLLTASGSDRLVNGRIETHEPGLTVAAAGWTG